MLNSGPRGEPYRFRINVSTEQIWIESRRARLNIAWRHLFGAHPGVSCHRNLPSGAVEGLKVCLLCGAELGLPLASAAAKLELLSAPGALPIRVWPVDVSPEKHILMRLRAINTVNHRARMLANIAWIALAWGLVLAPDLFEWPLAALEVGALAAWIVFSRRYKKGLIALELELGRQAATAKVETRKLLAAARCHARRKDLRYGAGALLSPR